MVYKLNPVAVVWFHHDAGYGCRFVASRASIGLNRRTSRVPSVFDGAVLTLYKILRIPVGWERCMKRRLNGGLAERMPG